MLYYSEYGYSKEYKNNIFKNYGLLVGHRDLNILEYYSDTYGNNKDKLIFSLAVSMLSNTYKGEFGGRVEYWEFERRYLSPNDKFTEKELFQARVLFEEMKSKATPVIYIDEIEPRRYL